MKRLPLVKLLISGDYRLPFSFYWHFHRIIVMDFPCLNLKIHHGNGAGVAKMENR